MGTVAFVSPAQAQATSKRKINIAGRQRMLTQRMAMASLMIRSEIEVEKHFSMLSGARDLFAVSLAGLRSGSAELELPIENNQSVLAALKRVEDGWTLYGALMEEIIAEGSVSTRAMNLIASTNLRFLSQVNIVVKKLVSAYGGLDVSADVANAIDIAGRQRMLSQKMAKEAAMIGLRIEVTDNRASLRETIELFDNSLWSLMNGDPAKGIPTPPGPVLEQLRKVEALWLDTYPILGEVADKGRADAFDLTEVAFNQDPLLSDMNAAVTLYDRFG